MLFDPDIEWSSYLGGAGSDYGYGIAVDASGNVLVTGSTYSSGWVSCGWDTSHNGDYDGYVLKIQDAFEVNTTLDVVDPNDGLLSLREAITDVYNDSSVDTIVFDSGLTASGPAVITLDPTLGQLVINSDLVIYGPGAGLLTIRRDPAAIEQFRIFEIESGVTARLSGLTITGGDADFGGGLLIEGNAILTECIVSDNAGYFSGGGIYVNSGSLEMLNCTVHDNNVYNNGGGISIYGGSGDVLLTNCTVNNNSATSPYAGESYGGGICMSGGGSLSLINTTVSGNVVNYNGGGLYVISGNCELTNTTVTNNHTGNDGGGIYSSLGNTILSNSIVAGNLQGTGNDPDDVAGSFDAAGSHNLIGVIDGSAGLDTPGNDTLYGTTAAPLDPKLDPLTDNGGPTMTHATQPDSPAIDVGDDVLAVDQLSLAMIAAQVMIRMMSTAHSMLRAATI